MFESNHLHLGVAEPHYTGSASPSPNRPVRNAQDFNELDALLSKEVSPNKRAIIETLISAWGSNSKFYTEQTG